MAKKIRFTPKKDADKWRLNIPAKISESGKRERHFFRTHELAKAAADKLKAQVETFGVQARAIAPSLAEAATAAALLLEPYGLTILEAARMVAEQRKRETASKPLADAAAAWLLACEGLRPRTVRNYRLTTERLAKVLGDRLLATITAEELQPIIAPAGNTGASVLEQIRNAKAFWRYSAGRGWCEAVVFNKVEVPKETRDADEIAILSPEETVLLLGTAEKYFPQAVASFALQLFAGIRTEEITRMDAEHVTDDGIDLPASVTKKGRRRHITPNATLAAWLAKYPFEPCSNWRETSAACRRLAGWDVSARLLKAVVAAGRIDAPPAATRGPWPQNALRHSHASYAVASGVPLESLLFEFGHVGSSDLLRQHYVGRASKKQARAYFAIAPEA